MISFEADNAKGIQPMDATFEQGCPQELGNVTEGWSDVQIPSLCVFPINEKIFQFIWEL